MLTVMPVVTDSSGRVHAQIIVIGSVKCQITWTTKPLVCVGDRCSTCSHNAAAAARRPGKLISINLLKNKME